MRIKDVRAQEFVDLPAVLAHPLPYSLALWADDQKAAMVGHDPKSDEWSLNYEAAWVAAPDSFPLSPALPFVAPPSGYAVGAVKRFVENLLPEGRALDAAAAICRVTKGNVYALILALGTETTGAFRFLPSGVEPPAIASKPPREISREELEGRLNECNGLSLAVWDGKVSTAIAGVQEKMMVYIDVPLDHGGRLMLAEPPLSSTHILKPEPNNPRTPHLVVNEHFCVSLARRMGLPAVEVSIYRSPRPILVVRRFDRVVQRGPTGPVVKRLHIIDACQASDMPVAYKYERNFGNGEHVRNIREGVGFEVLFGRVEQTVNKVAARMTLLRWALFQFLIGNSDAHGKNFSFFVQQQGLVPAPWYDLVSVAQYPSIDQELAMGWGDAFKIEDVTAFELASFAKRCGVDRPLLRFEAQRMAKVAAPQAVEQAKAADYIGDAERGFSAGLCAFVLSQAERLALLAGGAAEIGETN